MKPYFLLIASALVLASCNRMDTLLPVTSASGRIVETDPNSQSGELRAWTGGVGDVTATVLYQTTDGTGAEGQKVTAPISANGTFNVTLPTSIDSSKLSAFIFDTANIAGPNGTCTGAPKISDTSAKQAGLQFSVVSPNRSGYLRNAKETKTETPTQTTTVFSDGDFVYLDRPVSIIGDMNCKSTYNGITFTQSFSFSVKMAKGWNLFNVQATSIVNSNDPANMKITARVTAGSISTDQWMYMGKVSAQRVNSLSLFR